MSFYRTKLFPRIMNWYMASGPEAQYRGPALTEVSGDVLEIGFGTGLNLPHYPPQVRRLTAVDANPGMRSLALKHIAESGISVELRLEEAERLSFGDETFDSVVSAWTLCSIADAERALREIYRVLRPGGRFFFIEHRLSRDAKVQRWQHWLTPINRRIAEGCRLDRDMKALVARLDWTVERLDEFYAEKFPEDLRLPLPGCRAQAESSRMPRRDGVGECCAGPTSPTPRLTWCRS